MSETRVTLRPITEEDLPDYVVWLNDPEVVQFTSVCAGTITSEGEREWFARISAADARERHWAIVAEGRHIGNCALMPHPTQNKAGFGIIVGDKSAWGKGYGTAALREVLRIAFAEMELHRVHLTVFPENARGRRCYAKCGFRQEGHEREAYFKRDKWHDLITMAILREEWEARRGDPLGRPTDDVTIRSYRQTDHPAAVTLWEASDLHLGGNDTPEMIAWKLSTQPGFFLVAEMDGKIVGTVIGSLERGWGWVQRLAVHPGYRRRGIARRLMQEAEQAHAALGAYRACLLTHRENAAAAQALYQSLGYETWEKVIVMSRELGTPKGAAGEEECCGG